MDESVNIGQYQIVKELYHGPVTTIYEAYQPTLQRTVLIKKLHQKLVEEKDIRDRFAREAQVCAQLNHPNIVEIYDFHATPEATFLVLEYVKGKDLRELMAGEPLPLEVALSIARQVLEGLVCAHDRGVTHRDIKPSNILISLDGIVKISDFGLAIMEGGGGLTRQGSVVGTPAYMSPEQAGGKKIEQASDIFSLGVSFLEMLTGVSAYKSDSFSDFYRKILFEPVPRLSHFRTDLPPALDKLLSGMMERNPVKRPRNAVDIINTLESIATEAELAPGKDTIKQFYRQREEFGPSAVRPDISSTQKRMRRRKRVWLAVPGLLLVLVAAGLVYIQLKEREIVSPQIAELRSPTLASDSNFVEVNDSAAVDSPLFIENTSPSFQNTIQNTENSEKRKDFEKSTPIRNEKPPESNQEAGEAEAAPEMTMDLSGSFPEDEPETVFKDPGILLVGNKSWGYVFLDGDSLGLTPIDTMKIPPGKHEIVFSRPDYHLTVSQSVDVVSGAQISVDLTEYIAFINVSTGMVGAEIWVDGKYIDTTPAPPVMVALGERKIELRNRFYKSYEELLEFYTPGDTVVRRIKMEPLE